MGEKHNFNLDSPPSEPGPTGVRRVNNLPVYIIGAGIAALLLMMGMAAYDRAQWAAHPDLTVKTPSNSVDALSPPEPPEAEGILPVVGIPVAEHAALNAGASCNGDEIFCSTATTNRPAETFQKLVAALPQGNTGKDYRVVVSVVAEPPAKE
jgi:hypothetical protein